MCRKGEQKSGAGPARRAFTYRSKCSDPQRLDSEERPRQSPCVSQKKRYITAETRPLQFYVQMVLIFKCHRYLANTVRSRFLCNAGKTRRTVVTFVPGGSVEAAGVPGVSGVCLCAFVMSACCLSYVLLFPPFPFPLLLPPSSVVPGGARAAVTR